MRYWWHWRWFIIIGSCRRGDWLPSFKFSSGRRLTAQVDNHLNISDFWGSRSFCLSFTAADVCHRVLSPLWEAEHSVKGMQHLCSTPSGRFCSTAFFIVHVMSHKERRGAFLGFGAPRVAERVGLWLTPCSPHSQASLLSCLHRSGISPDHWLGDGHL